MASCKIYYLLSVQITYFPILFTVASQHGGVITLGQIFSRESSPVRLASSHRHDCFLNTFGEIVFRWWFTGIMGLVQFFVSYGLKVEIDSCTFVNCEQRSCNDTRTTGVELEFWVSDQYYVLQAFLQYNRDILLISIPQSQDEKFWGKLIYWNKD